MSELIKNKADLIEYLTTKQIASKSPPEWVYISSKVRKDILTDEMQGKFIYKGSVDHLYFESVGGGVYRAWIHSVYTRKETKKFRTRVYKSVN